MTAEPVRPTETPRQPPPRVPTPAQGAQAERQHPPEKPTGRRLAILTITALGVVYGDIGTSVLYAMKECFHSEFGVPATQPNVYGVLSLIVWALTLVVSVKYIVFILRADNRGEGGILALLALLQQRLHRIADRKRYLLLVGLGLFGSALLYGDGIITPAISVLSAVEGLNVATPVFERWVVPLTVVILGLLFFLQDEGTARVGGIFGPVMLLWFASIATFGVLEIVQEPHILLAINPWYGVRFFIHNGTHGFLILGAVVLVVTGGEALYADMGHFGKRPIRLAWFAFVFPALLLNYFGQGALLLRDPSATDNPFYRLIPEPLLIPMVVLATTAAVIASQALISGAFSLTRQAMQLGYMPRVTVRHTSAHEAGQIYIPEVNKALAVGCIVLVLAFRSSTNLAAAYGIAVTGTMVITTLLFYMIARSGFGWSQARALAFLLFFLAIDLSFLGANAVKIEHGGWVPLVIAVVIYTAMSTWKRGREILRILLERGSLPLDLFLEDVGRSSPPRVPGTAVFMTSDAKGAPVVLLHHLKHNKMLHNQVVLLSVLSVEVPEVPRAERVQVASLGQGFYRILARYGFMETPNVPEIMEASEALGLRVRMADTSFYLGRERIIPVKSRLTKEESATLPYPGRPMWLWRKKLFALMSRNARSATEYFGIPPNRVVELGAQVEF
ncbi:MAG TPA: potassium transporter Kup [Gemmatimonadaceae bacterium]|nr:potassium transporter Kup [Gemmatimonadaceae bacterium]